MDIKTVIGKSLSKASKIIQIPYRFIIAICWLFDINKRKNSCKENKTKSKIIVGFFHRDSL